MVFASGDLRSAKASDWYISPHIESSTFYNVCMLDSTLFHLTFGLHSTDALEYRNLRLGEEPCLGELSGALFCTKGIDSASDSQKNPL
jgi:hypothetical protein